LESKRGEARRGGERKRQEETGGERRKEETEHLSVNAARNMPA